MPNRLDLFHSRLPATIAAIGLIEADCIAVGSPVCAGVVGIVSGVFLLGLVAYEQFTYVQINTRVDMSQNIFGLEQAETLHIKTGEGHTARFTRTSAVSARNAYHRESVYDSHFLFEVETTSTTTGETLRSLIDFDTAAGKSIISSEDPSVGNGSENKRIPGWSAHYTYDNVNPDITSSLPLDEGNAQRLTKILWA
ncbi:hypothetical protein Slin14017_G108550 [Septoria linicola]|nr:hypothetical protein Slin14017_G108550 [Septoria linicola]